jgi:hypothetical protein
MQLQEFSDVNASYDPHSGGALAQKKKQKTKNKNKRGLSKEKIRNKKFSRIIRVQ